MKRIATVLLALLMALSLSITGWAEEPEILETPVIQETPEIQEVPEIREEAPTQEPPEIRETTGPAETPEIRESPKPAESAKPEKKQEKTKKKQENQKAAAQTEVPAEEPALDREACETYATFFREEADLNNAVIAGIFANIQRESGFDPMREGDNGNAFGLCQWNEKRQKRLDALCERASLNRNEISTQQIFMIAELQVYYPDTWMLLQWLADTEDDAAWAAWYICKNYEAPVHVEEELLIREQLAKDYFQLLTD